MKIDTGSTAWMLASTALVLLMTPGLAFFYGGMTRAKSVLNMMMMSWVAIITVTIAWVLYGDSLSFGKGNGFVGGLEYLGEHGLVNSASRSAGIPDLVFSAFQLTFAVITVALISGAIADRTKFGAWAVFSVAWATLVYFPVAHWVWGGGWLSSLGIEDCAGGTVVHVNAGAAGLALALVLGKRRGWGKDPMRPHNLPLVLLGAGELGSLPHRPYSTPSAIFFVRFGTGFFAAGFSAASTARAVDTSRSRRTTRGSFSGSTPL